MVKAVKYLLTVCLDFIHGDYMDINEIYIAYEDLNDTQKKILSDTEIINGFFINYHAGGNLNVIVCDTPRNTKRDHSGKITQSDLIHVELDDNLIDTFVSIVLNNYEIKRQTLLVKHTVMSLLE